jgi:hypothetical protein
MGGGGGGAVDNPCLRVSSDSSVAPEEPYKPSSVLVADAKEKFEEWNKSYTQFRRVLGCNRSFRNGAIIASSQEVPSQAALRQLDQYKQKINNLQKQFLDQVTTVNSRIEHMPTTGMQANGCRAYFKAASGYFLDTRLAVDDASTRVRVIASRIKYDQIGATSVVPNDQEADSVYQSLNSKYASGWVSSDCRGGYSSSLKDLLSKTEAINKSLFNYINGYLIVTSETLDKFKDKSACSATTCTTTTR